MSRLEELAARCVAGVNLEINPHLREHKTAQQWVEHMEMLDLFDADAGIRAEIIRRGTVVDLRFWPDSANGFHIVTHFDVNYAVDKALAILNAEHVTFTPSTATPPSR